MFGLDLVKNREALTALHRAGIAFAALDAPAAAPGPNLQFLDALAEFSNKLLRQDKRHVLKVRMESTAPPRPRPPSRAFLVRSSWSRASRWAPCRGARSGRR